MSKEPPWRTAEVLWFAHLVRCFGEAEALYYRYNRVRETHPAYDAAARAAERAYEAAFLEGTI